MDSKHSRAFLVSLEILNRFGGAIKKADRVDALWEIFECIRKGIVDHESGRRYPMHWLDPGKN